MIKSVGFNFNYFFLNICILDETKNNFRKQSKTVNKWGDIWKKSLKTGVKS